MYLIVFMGCASVSSVTATRQSNEFLYQIVNEIVERFEKSVLSAINSNNPKEFFQLSAMLKSQLMKAEKELVIHTSSIIHKETRCFELLQSYLISSCMAKEGYFRYLNSMHSLNYLHCLKIKLIEEYATKKGCDNASILQMFSKSILGCYRMQGFHELEGILGYKHDHFQMIIHIYRQTLSEKKILEEELKALDENGGASIAPCGFYVQSDMAKSLNVRLELEIKA